MIAKRNLHHVPVFLLLPQWPVNSDTCAIQRAALVVNDESPYRPDRTAGLVGVTPLVKSVEL